MPKSIGQLLEIATTIEKNVKDIDVVVKEVCQQKLEGNERWSTSYELVAAQLQKRIGSIRLVDTLDWAVSMCSPLREVVHSVEKGCEENMAKTEHLAWWLSGVAWSAIVAQQKSMPCEGIHVWVDTAREGNSEEATWISLRGGKVSIRRDSWGDTVWRGQRDAALSYPLSMSGKDLVGFMRSKLEYISWAQYNFEREHRDG